MFRTKKYAHRYASFLITNSILIDFLTELSNSILRVTNQYYLQMRCVTFKNIVLRLFISNS